MPLNHSWLALALAPGINAARLEALFQRYEQLDVALAAGDQALAEAGLAAATIAALRNPDAAILERALAWLDAPQHTLVHWLDPRYPPLLKASPHAPAALFVAGDAALLQLPQLAIVGSRNATAGGLQTARDFAAHLTRSGLIVTSGLALGVDAAAHSGALAAGGATIAVLGTGIDLIYPTANQELAERILANGALVSEFAPGTPPRRAQFPQRNRIIAALSLGTLVVEAGINSGSLITARYAGDNGREVFAIPGSIHNPLSKGCHRLIKQGAKLVESAPDIIIEIGAQAELQFATPVGAPATANAAAEKAAPSAEDADYARLLKCMGFDPVSIDTLAGRSGLTAEELSSMLLILELQGRVFALPGGQFQQASQLDHPHE
ncbi:MAG: DNA-processing protein DprA [Gammaproteobacteria bacterium]|jgi:DNA processing protein|nr:DNA-processing protein DprA [Gammaproteobacteria bacterium]